MKSHGVTKWEIWLEAAGFRCCGVPLLLGSAAAGFRCCRVPLPGSAGKRARAKVGGTTESVVVSWCTAHLVENRSPVPPFSWHSLRGEFHQGHT